MEVELLLDCRVELAEGPIWDTRRRSTSWVDQLAGRVNQVGIDGRVGPSLELGGRIGAAVPTLDGSGFVLATSSGFAYCDHAGHLRILADIGMPDPRRMMNDGKCDAAGRFWAGTFGVDASGFAIEGAGALFRLAQGTEVSVARTGVTLANGMDWSPDGRTFYFIDSLAGGIDAFDFDPEAGELRSPRRAVEIGIDPGVAFADGMCVDADGAIWTAIWGTGEIRRYTPNGALDRTIRLPVTQPSSCVFAGDALDVLVITSAWQGLNPAELRAQPQAGSLFCATPGVRGLPTNRYVGA